MKRHFIPALLCCLFLLLSACGASVEQEPTEAPVASINEQNTYATWVQKEYRTVRQKNFDKALPDMTLDYLTDEYVRCGLYYDHFATPDEIQVTHYVREFHYLWNEEFTENERAVFNSNVYPSELVRYMRYVLNDFLAQHPTLSLAAANPQTTFNDVYCITAHDDKNNNYVLFFLQTSEDIEVNINQWSLYYGFSTQPKDYEVPVVVNEE